jgi:aminoglycoside phosphotransferase (APT) family kinase protein
MDASNTLQVRLERVIGRMVSGATGVADLCRLSAGASQDLWKFVATDLAGSRSPLILRRAAGQGADRHKAMIGFHLEAAAMEIAARAGVPVPAVRGLLGPDDGLGDGMVMDYIDGETLARRILREPEFRAVRPRLARSCGEILACLHAAPLSGVKDLPAARAADRLARYSGEYARYGEPRPVFEVALRWLCEHLPAERADSLSLVHGDFRNGNLIIGPEGVRAVLDWEFAHLGDPMEDLAWLCVNSWRFGQIDQPVGGFGTREELYGGYTAAGGRVDEGRIQFWEVLGSLRWGTMCQMAAADFTSGADPSVERAAIARRASETEIDLLRLLRPREC